MCYEELIYYTELCVERFGFFNWGRMFRQFEFFVFAPFGFKMKQSGHLFICGKDGVCA